MEIKRFENGKQLHAYLKEEFLDLFEDDALLEDTRSFTIQIFQDLGIRSIKHGLALLNESGEIVYHHRLELD